MTEKHTPAPWETNDTERELQVVGFTKSEFSPNPFREDGLWPRTITVIKKTKKGTKRGCSVHYLEPSAVDYANARLLAAAPEMLEALKLICVNASKVPTYKDEYFLHQIALDTARAAIAKAEAKP